MDNHRIHVFNLPAGGQRIPRYGDLESAQPRDDLDRAITLHGVETAKLGIGAAGPFHGIQAAFALGVEAFALRVAYAVACYSFLEEAVAGTEAFSDSESYDRSDAEAYTRANSRPDGSSDSGTDPGSRADAFTDDGSDSGTDPGSRANSRPDGSSDSGTDTDSSAYAFTDGSPGGRFRRIRRSYSARQYEDRRSGQGRKRKLQRHTVGS